MTLTISMKYEKIFTFYFIKCLSKFFFCYTKCDAWFIANFEFENDKNSKKRKIMKIINYIDCDKK